MVLFRSKQDFNNSKQGFGNFFCLWITTPKGSFWDPILWLKQLALSFLPPTMDLCKEADFKPSKSFKASQAEPMA